MNHTSAIIYGSVRSQRQGIYVANYIREKLEERNHIIHFIDPLEYDLPLLDKMYKEYESGQAPENIEKLGNIFKDCDGFIIVSGEYNHSIPPALKTSWITIKKNIYLSPVQSFLILAEDLEVCGVPFISESLLVN